MFMTYALHVSNVGICVTKSCMHHRSVCPPVASRRWRVQQGVQHLASLGPSSLFCNLMLHSRQWPAVIPHPFQETLPGDSCFWNDGVLSCWQHSPVVSIHWRVCACHSDVTLMSANLRLNGPD